MHVSAMEENTKVIKDQENMLVVHKDTFSIKINNSLFYEQLGKYESVMGIFKHIGF